MQFLMFHLNSVITLCKHIQMLLTVNFREIAFIHEVVQCAFSVGEVLLGQLAVLNFGIEGVHGALAFDSVTEGLPVHDTAYELQPLLQIPIILFINDRLKVLTGDPCPMSFTITMSLEFG